jgi:outer membrane receptor protein involved in Fe transport
MAFLALRSLTLALALSLCWGVVLAKELPDLADLPFEQLMQQEVVGASKIAQQISNSPSAVAIVTAADIRAYGYRTLADVINSMRGLYTTYDRRYQYMGGRGFGAPEDYAGRVMLLIDGYATQDSLFNQAYIDESGLVDLELVERIEYVPGTGSVTYGNNALLGIINVITRQGHDINATQLSGEVSSHGGKKQRITLGKQLDNGADVLVSASAFDSEGQNLYFPAYDTPETNQGLAQNQDGEHNRRVFGKYSFEGWTIEGAFANREKMVPTNPNPYTAFNRPFSIQDENSFLNIRYETDIGLKLFSASRLYHGAYAYDAKREYADDSDGEKYARRQFEGRWWGIEQKFVGNWFRDHAIVFGMEYRNDYQQDFRWSFQDAAGQIVRTEQELWSRQTTSLYLTDEYRLSDQWSLNFGGRYDKASDLAGNWSPRLAAIFRPDAKTTVKASYSEAFRMPHAYERYYYGSAAAPERVAATELVLQHEFSPRMRLTGSLYHYRRSQQLQFNEVLDDYVADGISHSKGLELELERSWEDGMRARGSAAFQHSVDINRVDLANSPNVLAKLNLSFPVLANSLRVGLEAQYIGSRLTLERRSLGAVALANLTFSSERKWHGLSASLSVRNLFNRTYEAVSPFDWRPDSGLPQDALRMDGRTFWFQINYDL